MSPGGIVIKLAAAFFAAAFVLGLGWARGKREWERPFRLAYHGMTACLVLASVLLYRAILGHDFRYDYVIGYTSRDLEPMYLIASFWGGQEGTYLLWALFGALLGYFLLRGRWHRGTVMAGWTATVGILILFMLNRNGDPFRLAGSIPPDGRGLNPLLQDPWMAFHPPVVFLGYAAMTAPAVLAWTAAFRRDEARWAGPALRWTLAGFVLLGLGIILGGVWAYKVLGWGGFWGWDPVENASLIPWIVSVGLLHGLLVQRSTGGLRGSTLLMAMAAYVLVLYSTFLTRSGVLADFSVHSFPKGTIYHWLLGSMIAAVAVSALALLRRRAGSGPSLDTRFAWPVVLATTIVLFIVSALLVLIGTSWPILTSAFGKPSTPTAPFYNQVNLPIYVILLALLGVGPFLSWAPLPARLWLRRFLPSVAAALVGTVIAASVGGKGAESLLLWFTALLALASNAVRLVEVGRRNLRHAGAALSHLGFALMFFGIIAGEAWDRTEQLHLPLGEPVPALGRTLTYRGFVEGSEPEERWALGVRGRAGSEATVEVTMYQRDDGQLFKKPAIQRGLAGDFYISPINLDVAPAAGGVPITLAKGQPREHDGTVFTFLRYDMSQSGGMGSSGMLVNAIVRLQRAEHADTLALPLAMTAEGMRGMPVPLPQGDGTTVTFQRMAVESGTVDLVLSTPGAGSTGDEEALLVEASVKPFLWVLWAGTALLMAGAIVAMWRRIGEARAPERVRDDRRARATA